MGVLPTGTIRLQGQTRSLLYQWSHVLRERNWSKSLLPCNIYVLHSGVLQARVHVLLYRQVCKTAL